MKTPPLAANTLRNSRSPILVDEKKNRSKLIRKSCESLAGANREKFPIDDSFHAITTLFAMLTSPALKPLLLLSRPTSIAYITLQTVPHPDLPFPAQFCDNEANAAITGSRTLVLCLRLLRSGT